MSDAIVRQRNIVATTRTNNKSKTAAAAAVAATTKATQGLCDAVVVDRCSGTSAAAAAATTTTTTTTTTTIIGDSDPLLLLPVVQLPVDQDGSTSTAKESAQAIRELLNTIISSSVPAKTAVVACPTTATTYYQRLQTYTTMNYFAKPIHLSPILCAITGWELQPPVPTTTTTTTTTTMRKKTPRRSRHSDTTTTTGRSIACCLQLPDDTSAVSLIDTTSRLVCRCCHAMITVYIPNALSTIGANRLVLQYQQLLYTKHAIYCQHRMSAEYLINTAFVIDVDSNKQQPQPQPKPQRQSSSSLVVPTLLSRAIQQQQQSLHDQLLHYQSSLELVEQVTPWYTCVQKFIRIYPYILETLDYPSSGGIELPDFIRYYNPNNTTNDNSNNNTTTSVVTNFDVTTGTSTSTTPSLLNQLVQILQQRTHANDNDDDQNNVYHNYDANQLQAAEATMALIITGWDIEVSISNATTTMMTTTVTAAASASGGSCVAGDSSGFTSPNALQINHLVPSMKCIFCLSNQPMIDVIGNRNIINNNNNKRPRTTTKATTIQHIPSQWNQPYMAHRYYCPWVCGFPMIHRKNANANNNCNRNNPIAPMDDDLLLWNEPTMSLPLWQIVTNRLLAEAAPPQQNDDDDENSNKLIKNCLVIHHQLRNGVSPKYRCNNTSKRAPTNNNNSTFL